MAHLADDADPGVRARVAMRDDLDPAIRARLADPGRETSPMVWRALAASRAGAPHADALATTDDRLTRLILATNPATPPEVTRQLAATGDAEIAAAVAATRAGRAPDAATISQVLEARSIPTRPLATAPTGTPWPGPPDTRPPTRDGLGTDAAVEADTPGRHPGLVVGFGVALAIIVVVVAVLAWGGGSAGQTTDPPSTRPSGSTDTPGPTHSSPDVPATTVDRAASTPGDAATPAVTLDFTMTSRQGLFCDVVDIRIAYDAPPAYVTITDDADRELWSGLWPAGTTRSVDLIAPSERLHAQVTTTADPATFAPSGSVQGTFC